MTIQTLFITILFSHTHYYDNEAISSKRLPIYFDTEPASSFDARSEVKKSVIHYRKLKFILF